MADGWLALKVGLRILVEKHFCDKHLVEKHTNKRILGVGQLMKL
jgi:hypothetical protein